MGTERRLSRLCWVALACTATLAATISAPARARAEVIERVVAVVEEQAIFLSQIRRRAVPFLPRVMEASNDLERRARLDELYSRVLDQLIDEELIQDAAREMDVRVSTADIDRAISNVRQGSGLSDQEFWDAVRAQGFTESQYRSDVRRQLLRLKVLNQRVRGRVNITEEDVRRKYAQTVRSANRELRFKLAHLFVEVPAGATATEVAALRTRAAEIRRALTAETFPEAVAEHGGGDLGWLSQDDLPDALEQAVLDLAPGELSQPTRGPNGFHVLLLEERELGGTDVQTFDEVRDGLYRQMLEEAMARQQGQLLLELRRDATITRRLLDEGH